MSSGGGKTQETTVVNEVPEFIESGGKKAKVMADYVSQLGYVPDYGLDVAGFSPMQTQAFQNTANAGSAFFGNPMMDVNAYMPQTKTNNLGFSGYSSGDLYDLKLAALQERAPAQYDAVTDMFIDPQTGKLGTLFTPNGSIGTSAAANRQVSDDQMDWLNYTIGKGPADYENNLGINQNAVDWNTLPSWAKELTNWLIPGYGVIDTIQTAKDKYEAQQRAAAAAKASRNYSHLTTPDSSSGGPYYSSFTSGGKAASYGTDAQTGKTYSGRGSNSTWGG